MILLLDIAPYIAPASATSSGHEIYQRFQTEADTMAIAVVDDLDRPIGLIERNAFLVLMGAQYGRAVWAGRPVTHFMKTGPVMADGDVTVSDFCGRILQEKPSDLLHGFIVTRAGRYAGVGSALSLLQASAAATASHAAEMTRLADDARQATRQAHEALAAKARFLAVMSHEIRTPLNGVLAVAEIIKRKSRQADLTPLVDTILQSGGVLLRLLNDALDLSRAEAAGLELDEAPLLAASLLDDVLALWSPQAELKGLSLEVAYDGPADLWVLADRVRLRQIFNNLVGNALKFTPIGAVSVTLRAPDDGAWLRGEVSDPGLGVPADRLEAIFAPFQQTEDGVRRGGAGLGLAVCRQIVERMGGVISARNNPEGGACFSFEIPVRPAPAQVMAMEAEALPEGAALHVLIVDDNATNRLVARSLCEMCGCTTVCVEDGESAVRIAATEPFDVILMDIKMPGMDGVEATGRIRSGVGPSAQTPIVALTANADPADAAFYRSRGMNGVVEKPIRPERLLAAMNAVVNAVAVAEPEAQPAAA